MSLSRHQHGISGVGGARCAAAVALLALSFVAAGCSGPVAARARKPVVPGQGEQAQAMVMMRSLPEGFEDDPWAAEMDATRRDADLAVRGNGPILASGDWPQPAQPSIENSWYVWLPTHPETALFLRPEGGSWQDRGYSNRGWGSWRGGRRW